MSAELIIRGATTLAGDDANPEYIAHIRNLYGLDRPFLEQLGTYLARAAPV